MKPIHLLVLCAPLTLAGCGSDETAAGGNSGAGGSSSGGGAGTSAGGTATGGNAGAAASGSGGVGGASGGTAGASGGASGSSGTSSGGSGGLGTGGNPNNINFFSWSVESETIAGSGQKVSAYAGATTRSADTAHTGKYSMKFVVKGNDSGNNQMGADLNPRIKTPFDIVGGPAMYYRWWMKIMPGFSWGAGTAKTKSSRVLGETYPRGYTGYVRAGGFQVDECEDPGPGSSQPGGGCPSQGISVSYDMKPKSDGKWHEYVVMVKPNTKTASSDAQFKVWVNGKLVGQNTSFLLHNKANNGFIEAWAGWMVYPYFQLNGKASDGGVIYVDDFSTDSTWNSSQWPAPA